MGCLLCCLSRRSGFQLGQSDVCVLSCPSALGNAALCGLGYPKCKEPLYCFNCLLPKSNLGGAALNSVIAVSHYLCTFFKWTDLHACIATPC